MIRGAPPLKMSQEVWSELRRSPTATCQRSYPMTDRQIHPFNEGGIQPSREAHSLQSDREICLGPQAHHVRDANKLTPPVALFQLAVDQACRYLPTFVLSARDDSALATGQNGPRDAEKYTFKPSLVKSGRQPAAKICRREWMTICVWNRNIVTQRRPGHRETRERRKQLCGTCVLAGSADGPEHEPDGACG